MRSATRRAGKTPKGMARNRLSQPEVFRREVVRLRVFQRHDAARVPTFFRRQTCRTPRPAQPVGDLHQMGTELVDHVACRIRGRREEIQKRAAALPPHKNLVRRIAGLRALPQRRFSQPGLEPLHRRETEKRLVNDADGHNPFLDLRQRLSKMQCSRCEQVGTSRNHRQRDFRQIER